MFSLRSRLAIDLGSYKTRIAEHDTDTIIDEIHAIVINRKTGQIMQVGQEIKELDRKALAKEVQIIWPMRNGMIADLSAQLSLTYHRRKLSTWARFINPTALTSIPVSTTKAAKLAIHQVVLDGLPASQVHLIEDVLAAAIGAELDFERDHFYFILLIGAGVSSIGVIKGGRIHFGKHVFYAGDWLDLAIQRHLYQTKGIWISIDSCRRIKHEVGTLEERDLSTSWRKNVWDRDRNSSMLSLTAQDIKPALEKGLAPLVEELYWFIQELPDEAKSAIQEQGILLAGGMAHLPNLDQWLSKQLNSPVRLTSEPDLLVLKGVQKTLTVPMIRTPYILKDNEIRDYLS